MNHGPSQVTLAVICESVSRALELEGTASVTVLTFKCQSRLGYRSSHGDYGTGRIGDLDRAACGTRAG